MKKKNKFFSWIKSSFTTGLIIIGPILLTLFILFWLFDLMTDWLGSDASYIARLIVLFAYVVVIFIVGAIGRYYFGNEIFNFFDHLLKKIPIIEKLYGSIKQISDGLGGKSDVFKDVVYFEFPNTGKHSMGFVVGEAPEEIAEKYKEPVMAIYHSTMPLPTEGKILFIPKSELIYSSMSVADGIQYMVSIGAIKPDTLNQNNGKVEKKT